MTKWLKLRQYAEHVGCSYWTIYEMVRDGKIPAYKLGCQWRVDPDEADEALRAGWQYVKDKAERRENRKAKVKRVLKEMDYIAAVKAIKSTWRKAE